MTYNKCKYCGEITKNKQICSRCNIKVELVRDFVKECNNIKRVLKIKEEGKK